MNPIIFSRYFYLPLQFKTFLLLFSEMDPSTNPNYLFTLALQNILCIFHIQTFVLLALSIGTLPFIHIFKSPQQQKMASIQIEKLFQICTRKITALSNFHKQCCEGNYLVQLFGDLQTTGLLVLTTKSIIEKRGIQIQIQICR